MMDSILAMAPQIAVALSIVAAAVWIGREQRGPVDALGTKLDKMDAKLDALAERLAAHCGNGHGGKP